VIGYYDRPRAIVTRNNNVYLYIYICCIDVRLVHKTAACDFLFAHTRTFIWHLQKFDVWFRYNFIGTTHRAEKVKAHDILCDFIYVLLSNRESVYTAQLTRKQWLWVLAAPGLPGLELFLYEPPRTNSHPQTNRRSVANICAPHRLSSLSLVYFWHRTYIVSAWRMCGLILHWRRPRASDCLYTLTISQIHCTRIVARVGVVLWYGRRCVDGDNCECGDVGSDGVVTHSAPVPSTKSPNRTEIVIILWAILCLISRGWIHHKGLSKNCSIRAQA